MATIATLMIRLGAATDGVKKGMTKADKIVRRHADKIKKTAAAGGLAVGLALGAAMVSGLEQSAAGSKLNAQLQATTAEAARFGDVAGALYADAWGDSLGDVNTAVGAVVTSIDGMRDASTSALTDVTERTLALSETMGIDVERAAQVAGQAVTSGLARDATHALDLIAAATAKVPAAVRGDLVDALDEYAPFMTSIGVTGERAMELLVAASAKGAFGLDKTGDALKEFTIRATDMSTASKVGYDALGLSQEQMTRQLLAGGDTAAAAFEKIIGGLRGISDPAAQSQAALALFGTPLEDLNVTQIPDFLAQLQAAGGALGEVDGAAARMGDTLHDNAAAGWTELQRSIQQALVEQLNKALPTLQAVGGFLTEHADIVVPLVAALGSLVGVVYAISAAMKIWAVVNGILSLSLWASPITWIVMGILLLVAAVVLIATKTTWFQDLWSSAWGGITAAASATWDWMQNTLWPGIKTLFGWIADVVTWPSRTALAAGGKLIGWFKAAPGKIRSAMKPVADIISAPYRCGFNKIAGFWNGSVGRLSFKAPSWVPGLAGKGFSMPKLPMLEDGGLIREGGAAIVADRNGRGGEIMSTPKGARVDPLPAGGLGGNTEIHLHGDLKQAIRRITRIDGRGSVQRAFGRRDVSTATA